MESPVPVLDVTAVMVNHPLLGFTWWPNAFPLMTATERLVSKGLLDLAASAEQEAWVYAGVRRVCLTKILYRRVVNTLLLAKQKSLIKRIVLMNRAIQAFLPARLADKRGRADLDYRIMQDA